MSKISLVGLSALSLQFMAADRTAAGAAAAFLVNDFYIGSRGGYSPTKSPPPSPPPHGPLTKKVTKK
jgi:hypothetical protein